MFLFYFILFFLIKNALCGGTIYNELWGIFEGALTSSEKNNKSISVVNLIVLDPIGSFLFLFLPNASQTAFEVWMITSC